MTTIFSTALARQRRWWGMIFAFQHQAAAAHFTLRRIYVQCQVDTGHLEDPAALAVEALQRGDHLRMAQAMLAWSKAWELPWLSWQLFSRCTKSMQLMLRRAAGSIFWIGCGIQWWKAQSSRSWQTFGTVLWDTFTWINLNSDHFDTISLGCILVTLTVRHTSLFTFGYSEGPFWFSSLPSRSYSVTDVPAKVKGQKYSANGTGIHPMYRKKTSEIHSWIMLMLLPLSHYHWVFNWCTQGACCKPSPESLWGSAFGLCLAWRRSTCLGRGRVF